MKPMFHQIGSALWLVAVLCARTSQAAEESFAAKIERLISSPEYKQAHWGLLIADVEWGNVFYEHNADKLFAPASVTKLYSVAAALDAFGPEHRFETPVYRRGEVDPTGGLDGDLIVVASGDLTMGGRTAADDRILFRDNDHTYANGGTSAALTDADPKAGLDSLARQVLANGIKHVRGDVLVDDRLFEKAEGTGSGPSRLTPIIVNDNLIDFTIVPSKEDVPAEVQWRPKSESISVDAQVDTVAADKPLRIRISDAGQNRLVFRGQIPQDHKPLVRVHEVSDAASFARALFIESLRKVGVRVDASPLDSNRGEKLPNPSEYSQSARVALLVSAPFREEAKLILKVSHNLHASTLPLLMAAKHGKRTLADGLRLQYDFLKRAAVDADTISFGGAAGGARADYTTARATVQLLRYMATRSDFTAYEEALPVLGVDGTLASIGENSPAKGKVRAKTGTLIWENTMGAKVLLTARALAGYMTTRKERRLAFALFVNNVNLNSSKETPKVMQTLAQICEAVYEAH